MESDEENQIEEASTKRKDKKEMRKRKAILDENKEQRNMEDKKRRDGPILMVSDVENKIEEASTKRKDKKEMRKRKDILDENKEQRNREDKKRRDGPILMVPDVENKIEEVSKKKKDKKDILEEKKLEKKKQRNIEDKKRRDGPITSGKEKEKKKRKLNGMDEEGSNGVAATKENGGISANIAPPILPAILPGIIELLAATKETENQLLNINYTDHKKMLVSLDQNDTSWFQQVWLTSITSLTSFNYYSLCFSLTLN